MAARAKIDRLADMAFGLMFLGWVLIAVGFFGGGATAFINPNFRPWMPFIVLAAGGGILFATTAIVSVSVLAVNLIVKACRP